MVSILSLAFSKYKIGDLIIVILVLIGAFICKFLPINENESTYIYSDIDWQIKSNTIPYGILCICTFGIGSLIVILIWGTIKFDPSIFSVLYSYLLSIALSSLLCGILGKIVVRPKPDTIAYCGGDGSLKACSEVLTPTLLADQFSSFPSAHAAEATASGVFIMMLIGFIWHSDSMFMALIKLIPLSFALLVSASRIWDRQNHIDDVAVGILIGAMMGYTCFQTFKRDQKQSRTRGKVDAKAETSAVTVPTYM